MYRGESRLPYRLEMPMASAWEGKPGHRYGPKTETLMRARARTGETTAKCTGVPVFYLTKENQYV